ncbi:MAG: PLP-dependent transferase [Bacteroidetes bacterium]|nr:PLP-dependent transferase [Bacteroidota bacterium]
MRFETRTVHAGVEKDSSYNSVITPIYQTSTFRFEDIGKTKGYDYTRSGNPTRTALEENLAALEGGVLARAVATGMAAINVVLHLLRSGDHLICTHDCYGGTERILRLYADLYQIQVTYVDLSDEAALRRAFTPQTRMVWIETPSNPLLNLTNIKKTAAIARERGALTVVDNTFLSPAFQRPFELGADLVIHSTTKYLNGHSDVVGGAVIALDPAVGERVSYLVNALGQAQSPFEAWLVLRGIKTLVPRMAAHQINALAVAGFLEKHPAVKRVNFPGLPSHPQHELAKTQQHGFGGMLSFELKGTIDDVNRVMRSTRLFAVAESLGGIESLICHPATMTHASMDPVLREKAGITSTIIRLSVGIENTADLLEDLDKALSA